MASAIYFNPAHAAGFATDRKLLNALQRLKKTNTSGAKSLADVRAWLQSQDVYSFHKPVRKKFARNPYVVTNVMEMREADLLDVQNLSRYNVGVKYLLTSIDVFSKFLQIVPLNNKTGKSVASAFLSKLFSDHRYAKPVKKDGPYCYAPIGERSF
jgi:2-methylisocitrate lyase-like PEP mutase family enzyme